MQASWKRCPKSSCPDYGKRLMVEIGQAETAGDLTVEHRCPTCLYAELGPPNAKVAMRTSRLEAIERLRKQRAEGFVIPMFYPRAGSDA